MKLNTVNGGTISVDDFLSNEQTVQDPTQADYYYLGNHFMSTSAASSSTPTPPYVIGYIRSTNFFNISLFQEPIGAVREQAQQYLMNQLGISQVQMCELKYSVAVPFWVNQFYSGTNLGFSFCPGATDLPE